MDPRARVDHQLSRVTRPRVRGTTVSSSSPGRIAFGSEYLLGRPAVLGDSGPGLKERGVDQVSWVTRAFSQGPAELNFCPWRLGPRAPVVHQWSRATPVWVQGTTGSASSPGCFGPGSEGLRGQPALPGDLRLGPRSRGYDQVSQGTRVLVRGPEGSTTCPLEHRPVPDVKRGPPGVLGNSSPGLKDRGVDQLSLATRTCVRMPEGLTSSPG